MEKEKNYYTVAEFAKTYGMTPGGVHYRIKTGKIRAEKMGGFLVVIRADEIERLMKIKELQNS